MDAFGAKIIKRLCNVCHKSKLLKDYAEAQWNRGELRVCIKCKLDVYKKGKGGSSPPTKYDMMQEEMARQTVVSAEPDEEQPQGGKGSGKGPGRGGQGGGRGGRGPVLAAKLSWREEEAAKAVCRQRAKEQEETLALRAEEAKKMENDKRRTAAVGDFLDIDKLSYQLCMAATAGLISFRCAAPKKS